MVAPRSKSLMLVVEIFIHWVAVLVMVVFSHSLSSSQLRKQLPLKKEKLLVQPPVVTHLETKDMVTSSLVTMETISARLTVV